MFNVWQIKNVQSQFLMRKNQRLKRIKSSFLIKISSVTELQRKTSRLNMTQMVSIKNVATFKISEIMQTLNPISKLLHCLHLRFNVFHFTGKALVATNFLQPVTVQVSIA